MAAFRLNLGKLVSLKVPVRQEHVEAGASILRAALGVRNLIEDAAEQGRKLKRSGLPALELEYDDAADPDPDDPAR